MTNLTEPAIAAAQTGRGLPLWCRIEHLLAPADHERLLSDALANADAFAPSRTLTSTSGHRRSTILQRNPPFLKGFAEVVRRCLPVVTPALGMEPFEPSRITAQATAHHDGDYYRIHRDDGHPDVAHRAVSFAFYFHREPREFEGGELALFDYGVDRDDPGAAPSVALAPEGNSAIFFRSDAPHEVRPVVCRSQRFEAGRLAINGWVSR